MAGRDHALSSQIWARKGLADHHCRGPSLPTSTHLQDGFGPIPGFLGPSSWNLAHLPLRHVGSRPTPLKTRAMGKTGITRRACNRPLRRWDPFRALPCGQGVEMGIQESQGNEPSLKAGSS